MTLHVRPYCEEDANTWDHFCTKAVQSTILHTRRFLSYHGTRFIDQSLIIYDDQNWLGIMPAASQPGDENCVISHPGATYGGIVHQGQLRGETMLDALKACCHYYRSSGKQRLLYKAVPSFYHQVPAQDDLYAIYRMGARRYRCDLSSTIDLAMRTPLNERRRRALKKAQKYGITISTDKELLPALWQVLTENLQRK
ncbi:MAG: hypothetical protein RIQ47_275, partial [Bacteroidota bacterium]